MLEVRRLRLLRELDRLGSIAAVADALAFTPSAISQQLAQLERETGVKLVERVGRGSRLTPAARVVLGQIEELLGTLDSVETVLSQAARAATAVVRVACFQSIAIFALPEVISRLKETAPGVRVQIVESIAEDSLPALIAGEVDLVVFDEYPGHTRMRDARLDVVELGGERMLMAFPTDHPLGAQRNLSLRDLRDESWGLPVAESLYSRAITQVCNERGGFSPRVDHRADDLMILLGLVEAGHAITVVPEMIRPERHQVTLRRIGPPSLTRMILTGARRTSSAHPAIHAVRASLTEAVRRRSQEDAERQVVAGPVAF